MGVSDNLTPTNTDNLQDSNGRESANTRAVLLVELANGRLIMITSERLTSDDGIASYEIDNDPSSSTYGQIFNPAGAGGTNPSGDGTDDQTAQIDLLTQVADGAGFSQVESLTALTLASGKTFVYTADVETDSIGIVEVNADGTLTNAGTLTDGTNLDGIQELTSLVINGNPILVAFAGSSGDNLLSYTIDPNTGGLTQVSDVNDTDGIGKNFLDAGLGSGASFVESHVDGAGNGFVLVGGSEDGVSLFSVDSAGNLSFENARGDDAAGSGDTDTDGNDLGRDLFVPAGGQTGLNNPAAGVFGEIGGATYAFVGGGDEDVVIFRIDPDAASDGTFDLTLVGQVDDYVNDISALQFLPGQNGEYFLAVGGEQSGLKFAEIQINSGTGVVTLDTANDVTIADAGGAGAELADSEDLAFHKGVLVSASDDDEGVAVFTTAAICVCAGTRIAPPGGEALIEDLRSGDLVLTQDAGAQPIRWVGCQRVKLSNMFPSDHLRAVCLQPGALGPGLPSTPLRVSRQHRLVVRSVIAKRMCGSAEVLVPAKDLVGLPGVTLGRDEETIRYYHLLLDQHHIVFANQTPAETLFLGEETVEILGSSLPQDLVLELRHSRGGHTSLARPEFRGNKACALFRRHAKNKKQLVQPWTSARKDPSSTPRHSAVLV